MAKKSVKSDKQLFESICQLIQASRESVVRVVNRELTMLYWNIGKHIKTEILQNKRAGYGDQVIEKLSIQLTQEFGRGWSKQQLWNCLYTVESFRIKEMKFMGVWQNLIKNRGIK